VALPATFTLAAAIGADSLAKEGVLPARLSAVDEAAKVACCQNFEHRHFRFSGY
jgi:magnesium-transporting ATPase (P-type)